MPLLLLLLLLVLILYILLSEKILLELCEWFSVADLGRTEIALCQDQVMSVSLFSSILLVVQIG